MRPEEIPPTPTSSRLLRSFEGTRARDARIVTNDTRQINNKVSVAAVAGVLGIPSTVMRIFLRGEGFNYGGSGVVPPSASS